MSERILTVSGRGTLFFLLFVLFAGVTFSAGTAWCQSRKKVILIESMPVPVVLEYSDNFTSALKSLYEDGAVEITILRAFGKQELAEQLLTEELAGKIPDLVVPIATMASQAAVKILDGTSIPIFFLCVSEPVKSGIVKKINTPSGTNVSGLVHMISRQTKYALVKDLLIGATEKRPLVLGMIHSNYPSSVGDYEAMQKIIEADEDVVLLHYELDYRPVPDGLQAMYIDVRKGIAELENQIDYWWQPAGPLGEVGEYASILVDNSRHPIVMGTTEESVRLGALLHLTPGAVSSAVEGAVMAKSILDGKPVGSIAVRQPDVFDFAINLTTAIRNDIAIPAELIELAEGHIYR